MLASVSTPPIPDNYDVDVRINLQQFLQKLRYDKTIFPVKKSVMSFAIVQVPCHEQIHISFNFLTIRNVVISLKRDFLPAIFLDCGLSLLVKRQDNCVFWAASQNLFYCKFFL